jgi:hypothetical protein
VKKHSYKRPLYFIFSLAALFCLVSCSAILSGLPSPGERKSIADGEKALVIIRLSADLSGKPMASALNYWDGGFRLEIAEMDTGEIPSSIIPVAPSPQAGKEGWAYFILKPGSYYLYVIPPGSFQSTSPDTAYHPGTYYRWVKKEKIPIPAYWFRIPKGKPAIYLGSLSVSCKKGGLFGQLCQEPSGIRITDESELARMMASTHFAVSETVCPEPLLDYGKADVHSLMGGVDRLGIYVPAVDEIITPKWRTRALYQALGWGASILAFEGGYPPGGVTAFYVLFYVPPATLFGLIKGESDVYHWEPCSRSLYEEVKKNEPSVILKKTLAELLPRYGIPHVVEITEIENASKGGLPANGLNLLLEARIMRMELAECKKGGLFSIDTSIRFILKDASDNKVLLDRTFLYAGNYSDKAYELWLPTHSACREIEEYCGEEGIKSLNLELHKAFKSAISELF